MCLRRTSPLPLQGERQVLLDPPTKTREEGRVKQWGKHSVDPVRPDIEGHVPPTKKETEPTYRTIYCTSEVDKFTARKRIRCEDTGKGDNIRNGVIHLLHVLMSPWSTIHFNLFSVTFLSHSTLYGTSLIQEKNDPGSMRKPSRSYVKWILIKEREKGREREDFK